MGSSSLEVTRIRPVVSLEQLEFERIELEWVQMNNLPIVRTQVVRSRGGKFLVSDNKSDRYVNI